MNVHAQHCVGVEPHLLHTCDYRLGVEVRKQQVARLDMLAARRVEYLDLLQVHKRNVREEFILGQCVRLAAESIG